MAQNLVHMVVRRDTHGTYVVMRRANDQQEYAWDLQISEAVREIKAIKARQSEEHVHNQDYSILGYPVGKRREYIEQRKILIA